MLIACCSRDLSLLWAVVPGTETATLNTPNMHRGIFTRRKVIKSFPWVSERHGVLKTPLAPAATLFVLHPLSLPLSPSFLCCSFPLHLHVRLFQWATLTRTSCSSAAWAPVASVSELCKPVLLYIKSVKMISTLVSWGDQWASSPTLEIMLWHYKVKMPLWCSF